MIPYSLIVSILFLHWIADFILQSDYMAKNKSKNTAVLLLHVLVYSSFFLWFGWQFAVVNGCLHFLIDFCTSRWTGYLYRKGDIHNFFVVIGLDQTLHFVCLFGTLILFGVV